MYQRLISMIPPHRVYVETHLGGGAVMRAKQPAERNIGVEIDPNVVAQMRLDEMLFAEIVLGDALTFLTSFEFVGDEFVYCDPPYLPSARRRKKVYRHDCSETDHVGLLEALKRLPCAVMVSGYASELYDFELSNWRRVEFDHITHVGRTTEVVWMNYEPPVILHDHSYVGANFRRREAVKRRRSRMLSKILAMPSAEKGALLSELVVKEPDLFRSLMTVAAYRLPETEPGHVR